MRPTDGRQDPRCLEDPLVYPFGIVLPEGHISLLSIARDDFRGEPFHWLRLP